MTIRYELSPESATSTEAAIHATGDPGGFFGLLTPLMRGKVRSNIAADLARLQGALMASI